MKPEALDYSEVETVAKALFAHTWGRRKKWEQVGRDITRIYLGNARAALAAIQKLKTARENFRANLGLEA